VSDVEKARILVGMAVGALLLFELKKKEEGRARLAAIYTFILVMAFSVQLHRALDTADTVVTPRIGQAWATVMQANR
jgi:hypothetical protein